MGQPKQRVRAATSDLGSKTSSSSDVEARPRGLRRYRTTTDLVAQEDRLDKIREDKAERTQKTLTEVGPRPSAGAFSNATSASAPSSVAGSDVAFMLDVDDMIDSIFSMFGDEDRSDVQSTSSQDPCSTVTSPTNAKTLNHSNAPPQESHSYSDPVLSPKAAQNNDACSEDDTMTPSLEASTCEAQDDPTTATIYEKDPVDQSTISSTLSDVT